LLVTGTIQHRIQGQTKRSMHGTVSTTAEAKAPPWRWEHGAALPAKIK